MRDHAAWVVAVGPARVVADPAAGGYRSPAALARPESALGAVRGSLTIASGTGQNDGPGCGCCREATRGGRL